LAHILQFLTGRLWATVCCSLALTREISSLSLSNTGKEVKGIDPKAKSSKLRCVANLDLVLRAFEEEGLRFENIGPQDIYDKNYTLIMGMMWRVVRKYHISGLDEQKRKRMSCIASERDEEAEAKAALLEWSNRRLGTLSLSLSLSLPLSLSLILMCVPSLLSHFSCFFIIILWPLTD
jgi:hypothetical protein